MAVCWQEIADMQLQNHNSTGLLCSDCDNSYMAGHSKDTRRTDLDMVDTRAATLLLNVCCIIRIRLA